MNKVFVVTMTIGGYCYGKYEEIKKIDRIFATRDLAENRLRDRGYAEDDLGVWRNPQRPLRWGHIQEAEVYS